KMRLINETDFPILDIQRRCASALEIGRQHSCVDQIHLSIESRHNLTARLRRMSHYEPADAERFGQLFDLWGTFGIRPLRIPTKPERTVLVNAQPAAVFEERFQDLCVLSFCLF